MKKLSIYLTAFILLVFCYCMAGCEKREKHIIQSGAAGLTPRKTITAAPLRGTGSVQNEAKSQRTLIGFQYSPSIIDSLNFTYIEIRIVDNSGVVAEKVNGKWTIIDCEKALEIMTKQRKQN